MDKVLGRLQSTSYATFAALILLCLYGCATYLFLTDLMSFGTTHKPLEQAATQQPDASRAIAQTPQSL